MKKILIFLWTITLIVTSTTSLVSCNTQQEYIKEQLEKLKEKNNITTNGFILEWIAPQEKPFNKIDNKWYFVIWRGDKNKKWNMDLFYNGFGGNYYAIDEKHQIQVLFQNNIYYFGIKEFYNDKSKNKIIISKNEVSNVIKEFNIYDIYDNNYIKSVYRWNNDGEPNINVKNKLKSYLDL